MPKCHIFKDKIDIKKGFIRLAHYLQQYKRNRLTAVSRNRNRHNN